MPMSNAGRVFAAGALIGDEPVLFDNTDAHLGVGDGVAAFSAAHTDLQGASKFRAGMDLGYPIRDPDGVGDDHVLRFRATYAGGEANFDWEEWGVFNAAAAGTMLNRALESIGTKLAGQIWILEVDVSMTLV